MHDARSRKADELRQSLIVSCQPVPDGPTDTADFVVGFARAAVSAGARAVRIESVAYVKAVRAAVDVPIIGIVKRDLDDSPVRITPFLSDVEALADAGADIIAFDATERPRPASVSALIGAIHRRGKLAMADCSSLDDARGALTRGADFVGTTLSGYLGGPVPDDPDIALIAAMKQITPYVIAEGRLKVPSDAAAAAQAGAFAVVVGSAITRTEYATGWFLDAIEQAYSRRATADRDTLAVDVGGTKIMAALVSGSTVKKSVSIPTQRDKGPTSWLQAIARATREWETANGPVGIAVTGLVRNGRWSALNPGTLGIPDGFPLEDEASRLFCGQPVFAVNDAQAAAWGEYRHGAGRGGGDMAFLTVSTGVGGGLVIGGRLLGGLAGHFGQTGRAFSGHIFEEMSSGRWIERQAHQAGYAIDAKGVFAAANAGERWARELVAASAERIGGLCRDIKFMLDVERIVIGGGVGLADGFVDLVREAASRAPSHLRPNILAAEFGGQAGVIGAAALALQSGR